MYTAQELADRFGLKVNTIYSYTKRGILPPPTGRTRAARYGKDHVEALTLYQAVIQDRGNRFTYRCFAERYQSGNRDFSDVLPKRPTP